MNLRVIIGSSFLPCLFVFLFWINNSILSVVSSSLLIAYAAICLICLVSMSLRKVSHKIYEKDYEIDDEFVARGFGISFMVMSFTLAYMGFIYTSVAALTISVFNIQLCRMLTKLRQEIA